MATATATIHAFVTLETAHAHAYGDAFDVAKAEIDALNELIKRAKAELACAKSLRSTKGLRRAKKSGPRNTW
jgi:wobble nucleotide-excising tRNase